MYAKKITGDPATLKVRYVKWVGYNHKKDITMECHVARGGNLSDVSWTANEREWNEQVAGDKARFAKRWL